MKISPMALALLFLSVGRIGAAQLPSGVVTDGVGVSVHFYGGGSGDLNMIKAAGCNVVRMDCTWDQIETTAGQYNFGLPDQLYYDAKPRGIRPMFILDYGNSLYGTDYTSTAWQQGFANFAAAAAAHYKGSNVIWEIWNEPNSGSMDATTYTNLVKLARWPWRGGSKHDDYRAGIGRRWHQSTDLFEDLRSTGIAQLCGRSQCASLQ